MRIDEDIIGGHIYVSEWLLQSRSRNHWRTVIDGIDLWFSDREIITRTAFDPDRVALGGSSFYNHALGSHTTLRKAAVSSWGNQETMMMLNDPRSGMEASASIHIHGQCLMKVEELHVKANDNELVIYIPASRLLQAFEFKPRSEAQ